jgi:hypothetical protein
VKPILTKVCIQCNIEYQMNPNYSLKQWSTKKFCSAKCSGQAVKIKDSTKGERRRKKTGALKTGTPEWLERIKATTKEAMNRPDVKEKISQPKSPMTEEGKIIRSDALVGKMPKNTMFGSGSFSHIQRGDYECSKGSVYFRSKWEANYALFLDFLIKNGEIKDWEFEADVFYFEKIKLGTRSYRPDFKVFNHDGSFEYHEVKGYMDNRSKTKLKRMAIYFPDVRLILIDKVYYADLLKKMKGIIHFYK